MSLVLYHKGTIVYPRWLDSGASSTISPLPGALLHDDKIWIFPSHIGYCLYEMAFDPTFRPKNTGGETYAIYIDTKSLMMRLLSAKFPPKLTDSIDFREVAIDMLDVCGAFPEEGKQPKRVFGWSFDPLERAIIMQAATYGHDLNKTLETLGKVATFKRSNYNVRPVAELFGHKK